MNQGVSLLLVLSLSQICAASSVSFFDEDIWHRDDRPFLFYGNGEEDESSTLERKPSADQKLESIEDITDLKEEVSRRLNRAVMNPTRKNMASYLEANAFLTEKAGQFAQGWRRTLLDYPEYDWTTTHPAVNAVSTLLSRERDEAVQTRVNAMKKDWALIFFGDGSRLTSLMAPIVKTFAQRTGMEVAAVSVDGKPIPGFESARRDAGFAARVGFRGVSRFPATVLMHREDQGLEMGRIVATGVIDQTELGRRLALLASERDGTDVLSGPEPGGSGTSEPCPACALQAYLRRRESK